MKKKHSRFSGAFGGGKKKNPNPAVTPRLTFDLTGPEFDQNVPTMVVPHTHPDFRLLLENLHYGDHWSSLWDGLLNRYLDDPERPHSVYNVFIRGNVGYVPVIIMAQSPEHKAQNRGMLLAFGLNPDAETEHRLTALHKIGATACTQYLSQATGDPDYFVRWEKEPQF